MCVWVCISCNCSYVKIYVVLLIFCLVYFHWSTNSCIYYLSNLTEQKNNDEVPERNRTAAPFCVPPLCGDVCRNSSSRSWKNNRHFASMCVKVGSDCDRSPCCSGLTCTKSSITHPDKTKQFFFTCIGTKHNVGSFTSPGSYAFTILLMFTIMLLLF